MVLGEAFKLAVPEWIEIMFFLPPYLYSNLKQFWNNKFKSDWTQTCPF